MIINAEYQAYEQASMTDGDHFIADSNFLKNSETNNEPEQL
jgi:hypothetical protein